MNGADRAKQELIQNSIWYTHSYEKMINFFGYNIDK